MGHADCVLRCHRSRFIHRNLRTNHMVVNAMKEEDIDFRPFNGDGRYRVLPTTGVLPGTIPLEMSRSGARQLILSLVRNGHTSHSANGGVLWVVLTWCQWHKVKYTLQAWPGQGYMIQLVTPNSQPTETSSQVDPMPKNGPPCTTWIGGPPA